MSEVVVKICRINPNARLPVYATKGSVALDVQTMIDFTLYPGQSKRVPTGIAIALPDEYECQLRPRSSGSGKGLLVHLGTVDTDYRGELMLNLTYIAEEGCFPPPFVAKAEERIGQMVVTPVPRVVWEEVDSLAALGETERGAAGFGSTGTGAL